MSVTATAHHLHGPGCLRPKAVSLPGFRRQCVASSTDRRANDRSQSYPGDTIRQNGHELVAIDEWLPGKAPSPYDIDLTDSDEYRTRYWRCRKCGHERNHRDEFTTLCEEPQSQALLESGVFCETPEGRRSPRVQFDSIRLEKQ